MTNTKTFGGALALLILIAALDNFIFIEQVPGYEGMMLIDARDAEAALATEAASQQAAQLASNQRFWVDKEQVNAEEFARFIQATHYQTKNSPDSIAVASAEPSPEANTKTPVATGENTSGSPQATAETMTAASGHADMMVQAADARAYCNWLGKELPTEEQSEVLAEVSDAEIGARIELEGMAADDIGQDYFSSFRCVKNLSLSQN